MAAYLISPTRAALAINAKCGGSVSAEDTALLEVLDMLLPRVEAAMNVASLTYGETTDTFTLEHQVPRADARKAVKLYLSNGYLTISEDAPLVITDPNGVELETDEYSVNLRYGYITIPTWLEGDYTVSYYAGFTASEADDEVDPPVLSYFENVPKWIEGVVVVLLTMWYRTMPKSLTLPENIAYRDLMHALYRELVTRIYQSYQRPRDNMEFAVSSVRTDGMLV